MNAVDCHAYLEKMLAAPRPGMERILAFYEHRVGAICTDARAMLAPLDDHLCHRGDGVFESIACRGRRIFQLDAHITRLRNSAAGLHLAPPCPWEEVRERIIDVARAGGDATGAIRVLIGRGPGGFGISPAECPASSLYIVAMRSTPPSPDTYARGLSAFHSAIPAKQEYLARIKNINYLPNVLMSEEARARGMDVAISFDGQDCMAEAAIANVGIVDRDGVLVCPEFTSTLPGTTAIRALELAAARMPVRQRPVRAEELASVREMLFFSSTPLCVAITSFNGRPVGDGRPGPVALWLRDALLEALTAEGTPF